MGKYRIKIETEKSGKKWYTAQVYCGWFISFIWSDIGSDGNVGDYCGVTRQTNIKEAEDAINTRRAHLDKLDSETIIHVEYKSI